MILNSPSMLIVLGLLISAVYFIGPVQSNCGSTPPCSWMEWGPWSACSNACGCGVRRSSRALCCSCNITRFSDCLGHCNLLNQHHHAFRRERCQDFSKCGLELYKIVELYCSDTSWDIQLYVPYLENEFDGLKGNDVYLGDTRCVGRRQGNKLVFSYPYTACRTSYMNTTSYVTYRNSLVYSARSPIDSRVIVSRTKFKVPVKCHISNNQAAVLNTGNNGGSITHSQNIIIEMFTDSLLTKQTSMSQVSAGEYVYIKVRAASGITAPSYVNIDTCFLQPDQSVHASNYKYYLYRNRCIRDPFTKLLGVSDMGTRFVFRAIEFSGSHDSTILYCNATICHHRPSFLSGTSCFQEC